MYENIIKYRSEYEWDAQGEPQRFKINANGYFVLQNGQLVTNPNLPPTSKATTVADPFRIDRSQLIPDTRGEYFRNWRPEIRSADDIWNEIVKQPNFTGSLLRQNYSL